MRHTRARGAGIVQCQLRATKQLARVVAVIRKRGDARDRIHVEAHVGHMESGANGARELLGEQRCPLQ